MCELAHELLDTQDTGYVSLVRINESLAAFGQKELSSEDQAKILELYTSHRFFLFIFLVLKVGKVRRGFMACST